jgi:hypothetical protein
MALTVKKGLSPSLSSNSSKFRILLGYSIQTFKLQRLYLLKTVSSVIEELGKENMSRTVSLGIKRQDFSFENSLVRVVSNRNSPEIKLPGLSLGPFEEGTEYEVYHWAALELERSGIVHFREDEQLDASTLNKIQWTERIQKAGQICNLPDGFYPKLRRCLQETKERVTKDPDKMREYERIKHLARDITNTRLKKIVSIASAPAQTENVLRNLTAEEKMFYEQLYKVINQWRTRISHCDEESE